MALIFLSAARIVQARPEPPRAGADLLVMQAAQPGWLTIAALAAAIILFLVATLVVAILVVARALAALYRPSIIAALDSTRGRRLVVAALDTPRARRWSRSIAVQTLASEKGQHLVLEAIGSSEGARRVLEMIMSDVTISAIASEVGKSLFLDTPGRASMLHDLSQTKLAQLAEEERYEEIVAQVLPKGMWRQHPPPDRPRPEGAGDPRDDESRQNPDPGETQP